MARQTATETDPSLHASAAEAPAYLEPYVKAARRHGAGFGSLLWASPATQAARFDAFTRLGDFAGRSVLDVGCGRADFLDFLLSRGTRPDHYVGIEAVEALAAAAERKGHERCTILRGDFVRDPLKLFIAADAIVFSGSLNTLPPETFYRTIRLAYEAAASDLVFNFLDSPRIAAATYLAWYPPAQILAFARTLCNDVRELADYLEGDRTVVLRKPGHELPQTGQ
jgi:SAM-dependent methyltransferase